MSNYSGIGQPYIGCPRCGTINNNSDRVTEWKLKSSLGKSAFVLQHVFSVIFYYGFGAAILGTILLGAEAISSMTGFVVVIGCSLVFGLLRFWVKINRAIKESDDRMSNPECVAKLKRLGIFHQS